MRTSHVLVVNGRGMTPHYFSSTESVHLGLFKTVLRLPGHIEMPWRASAPSAALGAKHRQIVENAEKIARPACG
jgi:hypothetical protein